MSDRQAQRRRQRERDYTLLERALEALEALDGATDPHEAKRKAAIIRSALTRRLRHRAEARAAA